jgi:hypothetical protein
LSPEPEDKQVQLARELLPILGQEKRNGWDHLAARDESWSVLSYSLSKMWVFSKNDIVTKLKRVANREKFMLTIIWNACGLHVADLLPDTAKFNTICFLDMS